jgi:hypothetical protein
MTCPAPLFLVRFHAPPLASSAQHCCVVDCEGSVFLLKISKVFLLGYTCDRKLLLDGRTAQGFGPIFSAHVMDLSAAGKTGLALSTMSHTLIVRLDGDAAKITNRWALPLENVSSSLAFHPKAQRDRGGTAVAPVLVRCTANSSGCELAVLDPESLDFVGTSALTCGGETETPVLQVSFVSEVAVALLDARFQVRILDVLSDSVAGRCDLSLVQLVQFTFPSHPDFVSPENAVRKVSWGEPYVYFLGSGELVKLGISAWNVRADRFVQSGQWLEALTLALKYHRSSGVQVGGQREDPRMAELLTQYLVSNAAGLNADIAAVCVEYAMAISRQDLVFSIVIELFEQVEKGDVLLEVLFQLVQNRALDIQAVPPHVFAMLLAFVLRTHPDESLETFLLALSEVPLFDLDSIIRICNERKLMSALCYVYTKALQDFVTPCRTVARWMQESNESRLAFGYRFLLFLSYSLVGVEFPSGTTPLHPDSAGVVAADIVDCFFPSRNDDDNALLQVCLSFDPDTFLTVFQGAIFASEHPDRCLVWLLRYADKAADPKAVELFVARGAVSIKHRPESLSVLFQDPALAERLFEFMYQHHPALCIECIERYPLDLAWYSEQLNRLGPAQVSVRTALLRLELARAPDSCDLVKQTLGLIVQSGDLVGAMEFIAEHRNTPSFPEVVSSKCQALLRLVPSSSESANHPLVPLLLSILPDISQLLEALSDQDKFALLRPMVGASEFGSEVTVQMINVFVELLCEFEPGNAYEWLCNNEGRYNVEFALLVVERHGIRNAQAYLLERLGKVGEALGLVLEDADLETGLPVAINLCISFGSESEWLRVLAACLRHHNAALVETALDAMVPHVEFEVLVQQLQSHPKHLSKLLGWFHQEQKVWELAKRILRQDLTQSEKRKRASNAKAVRVHLGPGGEKVRWLPKKKSPVEQPVAATSVEEYEHQEACWSALEGGDGASLANNLLLGTKFELKLAPSGSEYEALFHCEELVDAGL